MNKKTPAVSRPRTRVALEISDCEKEIILNRFVLATASFIKSIHYELLRITMIFLWRREVLPDSSKPVDTNKDLKLGHCTS